MDETKLLTLEPPSGSVPATRIKDAQVLQDMLRQFRYNDQQRNLKRASVQGLVDGNAPYRRSDLRKMGRGDVANFNTGTGRSYCEEAEGIFYDLFHQVPTYMQIECSLEDTEQAAECSRIMSQVAHETLAGDSRWDYVVQNSQHQMVLHGCGPLWFEDKQSVMPRWCKCGELQVPENSEAETAYWEQAFVLIDYKPHELYEFIKDEKAAEAVGWDVEYTKRVIMNAAPKLQQTGIVRDWEWYQTQFKQNSFATFFDNPLIQTAHVFWKEFDGNVTHAIIEQDTQGGNPGTGNPSPEGAVRFLFRSIGRFRDWNQVLHPMYYDKGNGRHYTVTGLGVKMYSAMVYENRMICKLADDAMAPKIVFSPKTESATPFDLTPMTTYAKLSAGWDMTQIGINGLLDDGLEFSRELSRITSSNLAKYRQRSTDETGNPRTATQVNLDAQQQYAVVGTQISRYYIQEDKLYAEIVRRLCDLNTHDPLATKFQDECRRQGVPDVAFGRIRRVQAVRAAGQGSAALRLQALNAMMGALDRLPEDGQQAVIDDWIAAWTGPMGVRRYNPKRPQNIGSAQEVEAQEQIAGMKVGVQPIIAPYQSPTVFAIMFLNACAEMLSAIPKGADPVQVLKFLEVAAPAALRHIQRIQKDPNRQVLVKHLMQQFKRVAAATDKLMKMVQQAQSKQQQGGNGNQLPPEVQQKLMIQDAKGRLQLKQKAEKHQLDMQISAQRAQQELANSQARAQTDTAIADLKGAAEVRRGKLRSLQPEGAE